MREITDRENFKEIWKSRKGYIANLKLRKKQVWLHHAWCESLRAFLLDYEKLWFESETYTEAKQRLENDYRDCSQIDCDMCKPSQKPLTFRVHE